MCHWEYVEEHAETAKDLCWSLKDIVFEGSGHCAHFSNDEDKYAKAVKSLWQGRVGGRDVEESTPKLLIQLTICRQDNGLASESQLLQNLQRS